VPLIGSLCTGYGGLDMAVRNVFGGELAWWADNDPGPTAVMQRHAPATPNLGDVRAVAWDTVTPVTILTAGYPCQPFSEAGKRLGADDPRHIWPDIARGIGALRPAIVVLENVPGHIRRGLDAVLGDLAALGYDATWTVVRAADVGAPHRRERLFVLAADAMRSERAGAKSAQRGRPEPTGGRGAAAADTEHPQRAGAAHARRGRPESPDGGGPAADAPGDGRHQGRSQPAGVKRGSHAAVGGVPAAADAVCGGRGRDQGDTGRGTVQRAAVDRDRARRLGRWGEYGPAVGQWEAILGRPVPDPTIISARGCKVLAPALVEWMMGLDDGHVTATPGLSRNQMLRLLGNGVVPQQAEHALRVLLALAGYDPSPDGAQPGLTRGRGGAGVRSSRDAYAKSTA
jgi:DNA (cytosine-5)-methyltransferase 1